MSKIKIFSLGGLNENGKNMYVMDIDNGLYIFEAGLKYTIDSSLGIDYIIPNVEYLKQNKKRIKGLFLTHGHDENIGAVLDLIDIFDNVNIYAGKFTLDILKRDLEEYNLKLNNLIEIKPHKSFKVGIITIFPINLTHSIPDNYGYAIYTNDGVIFFASDFVFDSIVQSSYRTDIGKLAYIGKQGVLCLMTESLYAEKIGHTSPNHRISTLIRETLNTSTSRIIFNTLSSHLYRIQELFDEVSRTERKIVIMGKKLQNMINNAIDSKYLIIDKNIIGDLSNINDENVVIVISNEKEKPYSNIIKIINGYDKYIKLKETDTVFLAIPLYEGREKQYFEILDDLAKIGCETVSLTNKKYLSHHASSEDLILMLDLMQPKYYFPIKGEYRFQVANGNIAKKMGIPDGNILLKQNGEVVTFENGKLIENGEYIENGSILIDGEFSDDVSEIVLKDRELLKDNGIVVVSVTLNKQTKKIISGPEILSRGFIYVKDNQELIKNLRLICETVINNNNKTNYIEYNKIKLMMRDELNKYIYKETERRPMIIIVLQEIAI